MTRPTLHILLSVMSVLSACASRHVSSEVVDSWSQRPEEQGKLPLGVVLSVERSNFQVDRPETPKAPAYMGGVAGVAIFSAMDAIRDAGSVYLHTIRMSDGTQRQFTLDHAYKVGDCIALRAGLEATDQWPVKALPGECKAE